MSLRKRKKRTSDKYEDVENGGIPGSLQFLEWTVVASLSIAYASGEERRRGRQGKLLVEALRRRLVHLPRSPLRVNVKVGLSVQETKMH